MLERSGCRPRIVIGESPDGRWREESYLISGLTRHEMAAIAKKFGQSSVFELDDEHLRVIRVDTGAVVAEGPRRREE